MKRFSTLVLLGAVGGVGIAQGAEDIEELKRELRELRQRTEHLERKLVEIESTREKGAVVAPVPARSEAVPTEGVAAASAPEPAARPWSPTDPIRLGNNRAYLDLSLSGLAAVGASTEPDVEALQLGGHDPNQRGFSLQNVETTLTGVVDPYFRAQANLIFQLDSGNETVFEVEEAFAETTALPWNLQVKGGQFLSDFGRLNATHPHSWDFVDLPLVNGRFLGGDGMRNPGARVSWLAPTPFYSELFLTVQDSQGETAHSFRSDHEGDPYFGRPTAAGTVRSFSDMLFIPRYAASFDLTDTQTLLAGASAAFGPNSTGGGADTQIYGMDLYWKWKPVSHHGGFPFVTWQTEAMLRRFELAEFAGDPNIPALPGETLEDYGFYSQVAWGFRKGWVAAVRGDYVAPIDEAQYEAILGLDADRASRWRLSPNLTYYPSEFSKVRLQYNFDRRNGFGNDHSVWLQFEFLLGAHAGHKF